jgi:hypothetical protein
MVFVGCMPTKKQDPESQSKAVEIESQTTPGVDDILRARKPGDLSITQHGKSRIYINIEGRNLPLNFGKTAPIRFAEIKATILDSSRDLLNKGKPIEAAKRLFQDRGIWETFIYATSGTVENELQKISQSETIDIQSIEASTLTFSGSIPYEVSILGLKRSDKATFEYRALEKLVYKEDGVEKTLSFESGETLSRYEISFD